MHNLTPHVHDTLEDSSENILSIEEDDSNILDWMQRLFAQDLGEGHLEHCVAADGDHFDLDWDFISYTLFPPQAELMDTTSPITGIKPKPPLIDFPVSRITFIDLPRRAPPALT